MKKLGILVNTDKNLEHVVGITKSAAAKGINVYIFAMDVGTKLLEEPSFVALSDLDKVHLAYCDLSCENVGTNTEGLPAGVQKGDQYRNTIMNHTSDKVIIL
jgi:hypothetical protein